MLIVVMINCSECIHQHVVKKFDVGSFPYVIVVLGKEKMDNGTYHYVDRKKNYNWMEVSRPKVHVKQLKCQ